MEMDGEGGGWMECCRLGGLLKLLELFSVFTAMMLHRVGNTGLQGSGWQDQGGGEVKQGKLLLTWKNLSSSG